MTTVHPQQLELKKDTYATKVSEFFRDHHLDCHFSFATVSCSCELLHPSIIVENMPANKDILQHLARIVYEMDVGVRFLRPSRKLVKLLLKFNTSGEDNPELIDWCF